MGKTGFIVGSKGMILCRRNEYGISNVKRGVMIKPTYLCRELILRLVSRKITEEYLLLEEKGMLNWEAYKENRESIEKS